MLLGKGGCMRTLVVMIIALMVLSFPVQAEDMQKYLSDTQEMVLQGKHKEALERYIWFHEHSLEHEPSMYGVRLSFALGDEKAAREIQKKALAVVDDYRLRDAITTEKKMDTQQKNLPDKK